VPDHISGDACAAVPRSLKRRRGSTRIATEDGTKSAGMLVGDDDKFTPTKHLAPPPHHSSRPAAAHIDTETLLRGATEQPLVRLYLSIDIDRCTDIYVYIYIYIYIYMCICICMYKCLYRVNA